jgi:UTP--glucose-1-phosphate uridylyltransferase
MQKLRKAVFPVAGFGTRFLPATKAMPKELLPIVDKPLIQYVAEEAIAAGIDTLIFVTGRNKRAIEDHFDNKQELEMALRAKGKIEQADMVKNIVPTGVECIFVRQPQQLGLGHAVLCAERAVGTDPFAVLLADDLLTYEGASVTLSKYDGVSALENFLYLRAAHKLIISNSTFCYSASQLSDAEVVYPSHRKPDVPWYFPLLNKLNRKVPSFQK